MVLNPYQKYQQSSVQTASQGQLIVMLYDSAIRFIKLGIEGINCKDYEKANSNLQKVQMIINELAAALNLNYPIAKNLLLIYEYMLNQIIQANIKKNKEPAEEVLGYLVDLKDSWSKAVKQSGQPLGSNHG